VDVWGQERSSVAVRRGGRTPHDLRSVPGSVYPRNERRGWSDGGFERFGSHWSRSTGAAKTRTQVWIRHMDAKRQEAERCMFPGCTSGDIHARGFCRAHHQKYRRVIEATKGTANKITWDDLVALGRCLESRQGARDPAFVNNLLEEVKQLRRSPKRSSSRGGKSRGAVATA
jgi:hypothetical protein